MRRPQATRGRRHAATRFDEQAEELYLTECLRVILDDRPAGYAETHQIAQASGTFALSGSLQREVLAAADIQPG